MLTIYLLKKYKNYLDVIDDYSCFWAPLYEEKDDDLLLLNWRRWRIKVELEENDVVDEEEEVNCCLLRLNNKEGPNWGE